MTEKTGTTMAEVTGDCWSQAGDAAPTPPPPIYQTHEDVAGGNVGG